MLTFRKFKGDLGRDGFPLRSVTTWGNDSSS
jgi:hypothetical protein